MIPAFVRCGPRFAWRSLFGQQAGFGKRYCCWVIASALICFTACQSADPKQKNKAADSTRLIELPALSSISKADSLRISNACTSWYDTALNVNGFNGGMIVAYKGNIVFEIDERAGSSINAVESAALFFCFGSEFWQAVKHINTEAITQQQYRLPKPDCCLNKECQARRGPQRTNAGIIKYYNLYQIYLCKIRR